MTLLQAATIVSLIATGGVFGEESPRPGDSKKPPTAAPQFRTAGPRLIVNRVRWSLDTVLLQIYPDPRPKVRTAGQDARKRVVDYQRTHAAKRVRTPAARPVVIGKQVVFRSLDRVWSYGLESGEVNWGAVYCDYDASPAFIEHSSKLTPQVQIQRCFHDRAAMAISHDDSRVYALSYMQTYLRFDPRFLTTPRLAVTPFNELATYDLKGGKLLDRAGGRRNLQLPCAGSFFLSPLTTIKGTHYVVYERDGTLSLLEFRDLRRRQTRVLFKPTRPISQSPIRCIAGVRPALMGNLLICSTATKRVIAFDLKQNRFAWTYNYPSRFAREFKTLAKTSQWRHLEAIVLKDRTSRWVDQEPHAVPEGLLLTPRDSDELHCVATADGKPKWKIPRRDGLYVAAVANGTAVVVGQTSVRAVKVDDGTTVWTRPINRPSGIGLVKGRYYLLPLSTEEIITLDLHTGRIVGRAATPKGHVPGNLVNYGNAIISQNATTLAVFPGVQP